MGALPPVGGSTSGGPPLTSGMLALARPAPACGFAARAAVSGLYPHSGRRCRPPAGLARRGAALPPRRFMPGIVPPPPRPGKGQAGRLIAALALPGRRGRPGSLPVAPPWPPLPPPRPGLGPPCPCGRSGRRAGRGLWGFAPAPPAGGSQGGCGGLCPPTPPRDALRPPGPRSRSRARKSTRATHTRIYALFGVCADQVHYFR